MLNWYNFTHSSPKLDMGSEVRNFPSIFSSYQAGWDVIVKQPATLHTDRQVLFNICKAYPSYPYITHRALYNLWTNPLGLVTVRNRISFFTFR